jgi:Zn-dependent alcohol dehydrogenase
MLNAFATIGCALLTAFGTINRIIGDQKLNNVLVLGGGGLGQAAVIVLRNFHETSITVVEPNATKAEYCKKLGAKTSLLSANQIDVNDNFSSAIETTGVPSVIEKAFEAIDSKGIIALIGVTKADQKITINPMPLHYGKQIVGIYGGNANPKEDIPLLKEALITSKTLKHLQFSEFELNGINDALRDMRLGKIIGRAILVMES